MIEYYIFVILIKSKPYVIKILINKTIQSGYPTKLITFFTSPLN